MFKSISEGTELLAGAMHAWLVIWKGHPADTFVKKLLVSMFSLQEPQRTTYIPSDFNVFLGEINSPHSSTLPVVNFLQAPWNSMTVLEDRYGPLTVNWLFQLSSLMRLLTLLRSCLPQHIIMTMGGEEGWPCEYRKGSNIPAHFFLKAPP